MKTLIYTCIYNNLYGTEFGGRLSREYHYKASLKNILNLNSNKFICFTSKNDLSELEEYFYNTHNVSKDKLEFVLFDLNESKYFNQIRKLKNLEVMKTIDRCFEIQYNKFFWYDLIPNKSDYDRIYWFDAGLSHCGLFPTKYAYVDTYDKYFWFTPFNENFLNHLNSLSEDKFIIVGKNNTNEFYWSQTIPSKYYNEYKNDVHIIGGFFGGKPNIFNEFNKMFNHLLNKLLDNEKQLYMEEQILSCLYYDNLDMFHLMFFDDWYKRDYHASNNIKYFYNMFEV